MPCSFMAMEYLLHSEWKILTFIFKQNNPTWSGQMYTPKVRIEIDGLDTWEVQVSQNGRILNFSTPSYQQLCPTKQNCTRDLAYKKLVIANPYEITEPRLVGARGGFYEIDTVFVYTKIRLFLWKAAPRRP